MYIPPYVLNFVDHFPAVVVNHHLVQLRRL